MRRIPGGGNDRNKGLGARLQPGLGKAVQETEEGPDPSRAGPGQVEEGPE